MSERRTFEAVKYTFQPAEVLELGEALARETENVIDLERKKSARAAEVTAQIKAANKRCAELATKISQGYEVREVEVVILYDTPRVGWKRAVRIDTNEPLADQEMTLAEKQRSFGFEDPEKS